MKNTGIHRYTPIIQRNEIVRKGETDSEQTIRQEIGREREKQMPKARGKQADQKLYQWLTGLG